MKSHDEDLFENIKIDLSLPISYNDHGFKTFAYFGE